MVCGICGNSDGNETYVAHDMMLGQKDPFEYLKCARCGCLQIARIPAEITKYYPAEYSPLRGSLDYNLFERAAIRKRAVYSLNHRGIVGRMLAKRRGVFFDADWFRRSGATLDSRILDVGTGNGSLLMKMHYAGFSNLLGVDPFIDGDIDYGNGVRVLKKDITGVDGEFDFIMMHHSLEHTPDPLLVLKHLSRLLKSGRFALIRIPLVQSMAWEKYGVNWVQLDAPRHFYLHTPKSMEILARNAGFQITDVVYDSTEFQFWGSEQLLRGISLNDRRSYGANPKASIFSRSQIREFRMEAERLNAKGQGDQACFYLHKP